MRTLSIIILALCLSAAALGAAQQAARLAPRPAGDEKSAIHMAADSIMRWKSGNYEMFYLTGKAAVYQGDVFLKGSKLFIWFSVDQEAGNAAVLDVYAGPELKIGGATPPEAGAPALFRLKTSRAVIVNSPSAVAADLPEADTFGLRAAIAHGDIPPETDKDKGKVGTIRYGAERQIITDFGPAGATVTLYGNAQVVSDTVVISADVIRLRMGKPDDKPETQPALQTIYATGAVDVLQLSKQRLTADELFVDWEHKDGLLISARFRAIDRALPMQVFADSLWQEDEKHFRVDGEGYFTTSAFAVPHYRIEARDIALTRGPPSPLRFDVNLDAAQGSSKFYQKPATVAKPPSDSLLVTAKHSVLYVESAPIAYWPYVFKDVRTGAFLINGADFGSSGTLGFFIHTQWDLYDLGLYQNNWSALIFRSDYYSKRGAGNGIDFNYRDIDRVGFAHGYYINDSAKWDDKDVPVPQNNRGELTWRDREFLAPDWHADFELGYLSDRRFLRTYDRDEFDNDKDRETLVNLSRISSNTLFEAEAKAQLNRFQTQVERQGVAYSIIGEPVGDTSLLWTSTTDLSHLRRVLDDQIDLPHGDGVSRFDSRNELSRPFGVGPVRLEPFVWSDATFYSSRPGDNGAIGRGAAAWGIRGATNFYRTYDVQSPFLHVDGLRHTITPMIEYEDIFGVSREPSDYAQNDEVDTLDEMHRVRVGVRNRLDTHRIVDGRREETKLGLFEVYLVSHMDQPVFPMDTDANHADTDARHLDQSWNDDYLEGTAWWYVTQEVGVGTVDNKYNIQRNRLEAANGEVLLDFWQPLTLSIIYKYYRDLFTEGLPAHSVGTVRMAYQPRYSRWLVEFETGYDFSPHKSNTAGPDKSRQRGPLGTSMFFTREMEDWDFSLGIELNQGRANGTLFSFRISPPGMKSRVKPSSSPI